MIVLIGESASGKSTVAKLLETEYDYIQIVNYTSRPRRDNESEGVDYHYISKEKFEKLIDENFFAEYTMFNNWYFGTSTLDCINKNGILVTNPIGLMKLKKNVKDEDIVVFYLKVSERERLIRMLKRGDDIIECFRRVISDQGLSQLFIEMADFVVDYTNIHEIGDYIKHKVDLKI